MRRNLPVTQHEYIFPAEQTSGISQINEAVSQMDSLTQQNTATVEELAATAKSLRGQVDAASLCCEHKN